MTATLAASLVLFTQTPATIPYDPKLVFGNQLTPLPHTKLDATQRAALKVFASACLAQVESDMGKVEEPYWIVRNWKEVANASLDVDNKRAMSALEKAWAAAPKSERAGGDQASVLQVWLLIDPAKAKELAKEIKEEQHREYVLEREGEWIAPHDPVKGAEILSKVEGYMQEIQVREAGFVLMRDDPIAAVKFFKAVKGYNAEDGIRNIIGNLNSIRVSEQLMAYFDTVEGRESCRAMMLTEIFESEPERAFATGASVETPNLRATSMATLAKLFSRRDPKRAALCADEAVRILKSMTEKNDFYKQVYTCADLGYIDTPAVREFLKSLEPEVLKHDAGSATGMAGHHGERFYFVPHLAAAWYGIDRAKSDSLMDQLKSAITKAGRSFGWRGMASQPLRDYLPAMAIVDPMRAAEMMKGEKTPMGLDTFYVHDAVNNLLRIDENAAKAFVAQLNDADTTKFLKARLARSEIAKNPARTAEILAELPSGWDAMGLWDGDHDNLGRRGETVIVARDLVKQGKFDDAMKLIEGLPDSEDRGSALISLAYACRLYAPEFVLAALQASRDAYQLEPEVTIRNENLAQLAGYAKEMALEKE